MFKLYFYNLYSVSEIYFLWNITYISYINIIYQNSFRPRTSKYTYICKPLSILINSIFFLKCGQGDAEILLNLHRKLDSFQWHLFQTLQSVILAPIDHTVGR